MGASAARKLADAAVLAAGIAAFWWVLTQYIRLAQLPAWTIDPVDLMVYRDAGLIVRHAAPFRAPLGPGGLYAWPGPPGLAGLMFTYPPFAAVLFAPLSHLRLMPLALDAIRADVLSLCGVSWITLGAVGVPRGIRRLGLTLLCSAAVFFTEPVQRTIYLGQIDMVLMLLVVWDLCQPARRPWQGAGVGIAAGIKLVPLLFIPYLLVTRRYRQAAVAAVVFGLTIAVSFVVLPQDAAAYWLHGLFLQNRAGDVYWNGNQSLLALVSRSAGSQNVQVQWLAMAVMVALIGLGAAALLDREGHRMLGLATCALTGLLVSPISWDHHWVWIVLAVPLLAGYAIRLRGLARWSCVALAAFVTAIFWAWPTIYWGEAIRRSDWFLGIIWAAPSSGFWPYRWHGVHLLAGNAYVLTGLVLLAILVCVATWLRSPRHTRLKDDSLATPGLPVARL